MPHLFLFCLNHERNTYHRFNLLLVPFFDYSRIIIFIEAGRANHRSSIVCSVSSINISSRKTEMLMIMLFETQTRVQFYYHTKHVCLHITCVSPCSYLMNLLPTNLENFSNFFCWYQNISLSRFSKRKATPTPLFFP